MGLLQEKLDHTGDPHLIAKTQIEVWLSEFILEISDAHTVEDYRRVIQKWLG